MDDQVNGRRRIPISDRTDLVKQIDGQWRAERHRNGATGYEQWLVDEGWISPEVEDRVLMSCGGIALGALIGAAAWVLLWRWLR